MLAPLVHLNGSHGPELARRLEASALALRGALETMVEGMAPNARDYYPISDDAFSQARREHEARIEKVRDVLAEVEAIWENVQGQVEARDARREAAR